MEIYCRDDMLKFFWTAWPTKKAGCCYSQVTGFYLWAKAWPFLTLIQKIDAQGTIIRPCAAARKQLQRRMPMTTSYKLGARKNYGLLNYAADNVTAVCLGGQASGDSAPVCRVCLFLLPCGELNNTRLMQLKRGIVVNHSRSERN